MSSTDGNVLLVAREKENIYIQNNKAFHSTIVIDRRLSVKYEMNQTVSV